MQHSTWTNGLAVLLISMSSLAEAQYLKVSNIGVVLPDSATLGDWACTYDSERKLIWEVKTADKSLRNKDWTYSWFDSKNPIGEQGENSGSSKCQTVGRCDTEKFVQDVNLQSLCGAKNWRLASIDELKSLVRCAGFPLASTEFSCQKSASSPTIDATYFPNSTATWSWSATAYADDRQLPIWYVDFDFGGSSFAYKFNHGSVRVVRNGRPIANVVHYDDKTGRLTLSAVQVGNQVYSAQLQDKGGYQFQLLDQPKRLADDQALQLPEYREDSGLLIIPYVSVFNKNYQVHLQNQNGVFSVTQINPL
ncbi:MAG: DUF1566 domain-containing protein [Methylococcaceae bacterium]